MVELNFRNPEKHFSRTLYTPSTKKTACGWNDEGVTKIARIILKCFANIRDREKYWRKKMNVPGNVIVTVRNYQCSSQNFGH